MWLVLNSFFFTLLNTSLYYTDVLINRRQRGRSYIRCTLTLLRPGTSVEVPSRPGRLFIVSYTYLFISVRTIPDSRVGSFLDVTLFLYPFVRHYSVILPPHLFLFGRWFSTSHFFYYFHLRKNLRVLPTDRDQSDTTLTLQCTMVVPTRGVN